MKCERCQKRTATLHFKQTSMGKTVEHHLCEVCTAEIGIGQHMAKYLDSFGDILGGSLFGSQIGPGVFDIKGGIPAFGQHSGQQIVCPACGQSFETFRKTGLFGCAGCYETFADYLDPVFRRVQGSTHHIEGKRPLSVPWPDKRTGRLTALEKSLRQAIVAEEYEEAARLRDQIRSLEQEIESDKGTTEGEE